MTPDRVSGSCNRSDSRTARAIQLAPCRLECAHNNAGITGGPWLTHEFPEHSWARILAVNLTGVWLCMKHELAQMLAQGGGGAIVNTASVAGLVGLSSSA